MGSFLEPECFGQAADHDVADEAAAVFVPKQLFCPGDNRGRKVCDLTEEFSRLHVPADAGSGVPTFAPFDAVGVQKLLVRLKCGDSCAVSTADLASRALSLRR